MSNRAWQPISLLAEQLKANLTALATREPEMATRIAACAPAGEYLIAADADQVHLATRRDGQIAPIGNPVTAASAKQIAARLYPAGQCTEPVVVAGLDQGWLWNALYQVPVSTPLNPGHRPPLFFLAKDIERLWAVLHFHDWTTLLADARVRLFVGDDAVDQLRDSFTIDFSVPWPKLCVTVDQSLWTAGQNIDSLQTHAQQWAGQRMGQLNRQLESAYAGFDRVQLADRIARGEKLRVMGITSRFTTFLQYSMRDWLAGMEELGHETRIVLEDADHKIHNALQFAETCAAFRPDVIVMIDHYRSELKGIPKNVPFVMWVQDHLPNIFSAKAGAAQGELDYCLGFGRLALSREFGYPAERFITAQVGTNPNRFAAREASAEEIREYECDVSYVSHASTTAEEIVQTELLRHPQPEAKRLLTGVFDRMRAAYEAPDGIRHASLIRGMITATGDSLGLEMPEETVASVYDFFAVRVNSALFRHQAIDWLTSLDVDIRLYGRGWEKHPRFAKYARGIADNEKQLCGICRASKINLQITPHGSVHQRLFDGLAAGGFFLMRYNPGDVVERCYRLLWEWCQENGITDDDTLQSSITPDVQTIIDDITTTLGVSPFELRGSLYEVLSLSADGGFIRSAASVWPEYGRVSFDSKQQLTTRVNEYLSNADLRRQIARSMRKPVIERFSYAATSRRLLGMISADLLANAPLQQEAA